MSRAKLALTITQLSVLRDLVPAGAELRISGVTIKFLNKGIWVNDKISHARHDVRLDTMQRLIALGIVQELVTSEGNYSYTILQKGFTYIPELTLEAQIWTLEPIQDPKMGYRRLPRQINPVSSCQLQHDDIFKPLEVRFTSVVMLNYLMRQDRIYEEKQHESKSGYFIYRITAKGQDWLNKIKENPKVDL